MATSDSLSGQGFYLSWQKYSEDVITYTWSIADNEERYCGYRVTIAGTTVHNTYNSPVYWPEAEDDGEYTSGMGIVQNIYGTFTATIEWTQGYPPGMSFSAGSTSESWTLDPPAPVYPMFGGAAVNKVVWTNDETNPTITYSYPKSPDSISQTIKVCISFTNGNTEDIAYREVSTTATTYTFPLTSAERTKLQSLLSKGKTATLTFRMWTVETFPDRTTNDKQNDFTYTLTFVNYTPIVTVSDIYDANPATVALTGGTSQGYPIMVRYMSDIHYKMNVELRKGALEVLSSYVANGGDIRNDDMLEGVFNKPTTNYFTFSATDNRLNTGYAYHTFEQSLGEYIPYIKLTTHVSATPMNGNGDMSFTVSGKYFGGSFNMIEGVNNAMTIKYAVYPKGGTATYETITLSNDDVSANKDGDYTYTVYLSGLDYTKQYIIDVIVSDKLMSDTASTTVIARPVYYWNNDEFVINVPLTLEDDLIINGQSLISILRNGGLI